MPTVCPAPISRVGARALSLAEAKCFSRIAGAVAFFPDKLEEAPYGPQVVLTDLELSGASATIGDGGPLSHSIAYTDSIVLTHEMNIFSLNFAGLRYFSPESNRYRYKLEGLDSNWYEVGSNKRRATYTTLPAGAYTFACRPRQLAVLGTSPDVTADRDFTGLVGNLVV